MIVIEPRAWTPLTDTQSRVYADARQYFEVYRSALSRVHVIQGW